MCLLNVTWVNSSVLRALSRKATSDNEHEWKIYRRKTPGVESRPHHAQGDVKFRGS